MNAGGGSVVAVIIIRGLRDQPGGKHGPGRTGIDGRKGCCLVDSREGGLYI